MPTSGSTNFSTSATNIINGALRIVGAIGQGETATTAQTNEALEALNMLVKAYEADGMPLWAIKQYSVPLTASASYYEIGLSKTVNTPKPLKVIQAFLHNNSTGLDIPMRVITRQEYNTLGNKTTTGQPIQIWYEPLNTYGILHTFPCADSTSATNCTINITYQRPFEDFDSVADEPDFPQEWFDALKYGLADRLAPEYGIAIVDRNDIRSRAIQLKTEALSFGTEEGSFFFQADRREW
jgi:hypothetical protein